ncbi:uncharacterized protein LOC113158837 [Anabas testudineus]|uniref:uncharacterized protein LOC113158837 n=1 Tax=Anabas testudineus TaxID=64144 RepID=UPI000E45D0D9|nr:uncharacterized protein LOC113158837 [Anabas testudineus]
MKKKKLRARKPNQKKHKKVSTERTVDRSKGAEFESFLDEMVRWFSDHQQQVDQLFGLGDAHRSGSVDLKGFELGLMNLDVPCQQSQLQTLTQLLKNANNMITYRDLNGQVRRLRSRSSAEVHAQISGEDLIRGRQAAERGEVERFVHLRVALVPFNSTTVAAPGSFEVILSSRTKVFSLIRIIKDRVGIQTSRVEVFRSRMLTEQGCLPPESTLEECGFKGGPEESPAEDTVYYDYSLLFTDCPLLNCDHYFRPKADSAVMRTQYC